MEVRFNAIGALAQAAVTKEISRKAPIRSGFLFIEDEGDFFNQNIPAWIQIGSCTYGKVRNFLFRPITDNTGSIYVGFWEDSTFDVPSLPHWDGKIEREMFPSAMVPLSVYERFIEEAETENVEMSRVA